MKYSKATIILLLHFFLVQLSTCFPQTILQLITENPRLFPGESVFFDNRKTLRDNTRYCESWKFIVENNDAGSWTNVPPRCVRFLKSYIIGDRYQLDSAAVADASIVFAKTVNVSGDGKDAWIFDVDDTLLSNVPYYADHGYGSESYDDKAFNKWVETSKAPALPESLRLYLELEKLGFTILLLTGRDEVQRSATVKNLHLAGYSNWKRLILRGSSDHGKVASIYKSEKRQELEDEGYRIHGSSGDQWSDLTGFATAKRSFKLPNPMYFIPG